MTWARALITGGSAGIGAAIAEQLASAGTDLVVVARGEDRLNTFARRLTERYNVAVTATPADLCNAAELDRIAAMLASGPPIDLLVNNAGIGSVGPFAELAVEGELRQVQLNVTAMVRLTHAVLPSMARSGRGHVLNVASLAGVLPSPGSAVYGATKAFVVSFTESLHQELSASGIVVTSVLPGYVRTEFQAQAGAEHFVDVPAFAWMTPDRVASHALRAARNGKARVVPGAGYRVADALTSFLPRALTRHAMAHLRTDR